VTIDPVITIGGNDWSKRPLRVALLINSFTVSRWIHDVVQDLRVSKIADVALVIKRESEVGQARPSFLRRIARNRSRVLYALYTRLDNFIFRAEPDPFTLSDIEPLLRDCPVLRVTPITTKHSDYFSDADVATIRAYDIDVAVLFGFRILRGRALEIARHGVWSYHHGDNLVNRGVPAGFWEVMECAPVTGSVLQVLNEELDGGRVIYRSYSRTDSQSVARNRRNYYWKSSNFLLRKLRHLYQQGPGALRDASGTDGGPLPYSHRLYSVPTNSEMVPLLMRFLSRTVRKKLGDLLWRKQWFMAYQFGKSVGDGADEPHLVLYRFKPLTPPRDRFWADPFPVGVGDRYFLFFEELVYSKSKGHIAVMELNQNGPVSAPVPVLERDYHLSHPFLFEWEGNHYLLPETADNRTVELYRAVSFPDQWEPAGVLLSDVMAVDATIAKLGDRWWMFVNIGSECISTSDELHLYFADSPLGPWTPHRRNPVKSDVRSARPAGRVFLWNGQYYRPSQDCSVSYGHAIVLNRIDRIDPDCYLEVGVTSIRPYWRPNLVGTHTINSAGGLTVVDGFARKCRLLIDSSVFKATPQIMGTTLRSGVNR
jgi:hypothetical protein